MKTVKNAVADVGWDTTQKSRGTSDDTNFQGVGAGLLPWDLVMVSLMLKESLRAGVVVLLVLMLAACGIQVPTDPHGTLERVRDGVLRVGVTENQPWVELDKTSGTAGVEADLISRFAQQLGSEVRWTEGSEAVLLDALERGELDVVVGGFLEDTPWVEKGAITRPYAETTTSEGNDKHVMIVRMGENGFLVALEKFLLMEVPS